MTKTLLSAAALATLIAAQATAQDGYYVKGAVGYGMMDDATVNVAGSSGNIDPEGDVRFMVGVGRELTSNWRMDVDMMDRYADGGAVNDTYGSTDIQNVTLMLNGIYDFNREGRINPYLGVGIGASRTNVGITTTFPNPPGAVLDDEKGSTDLTYQGLAGLGLKLSPRLSAELEYRYVDLGEVGGAGYSFQDMESHDLLIGLRWALAAPAAAPPPPAPAPAPPRERVAAPAAPACEDVDFIVYFEWDHSDLTSQAVQTVAAAASQAEACSITRVSVVGHTDRSGAASYNDALSRRRAGSVRDELVRRGVPASSITVAGRGESDPAVQTPDGVREPLNRRSEVVIMVEGGNS